MDAAELWAKVTRRVRDPNSTAHTFADVFPILSELQACVNAEAKAVLGEADVTVGGGDDPQTTAILDVTGLLPTACIRVETVRDGVRDITRAPDWRSIAEADRAWLKRRGGSVRAWTPIGPMKLAIYPIPTAPTVLTLVFSQRTPELVADATPIAIPAPLIPALVNLTEQVLLLRQRLAPSIKPAAERYPVAAAATSR